MTDYNAFVYPLPGEFYEQELTSSLDDGIDRWASFDLFELPLTPMVVADISGRGLLEPIPRDTNAFVYPDWSSLLFGHIIVVPARLDLGNVLSDQSRTLEIANLFLEDREWQDLSTDVVGLEFLNDPVSGSPATPYTIPSFGSYILDVTISADGPVSIDGDIVIVMDVEEITVPVVGTRVIVFSFQPLIPIVEQLEWTTDIIESYDGSEQRICLRDAPISRFVFELIRDQLSDNMIRALMFDWLPRVFAVPVWWEMRTLDTQALTGATVLNVSTLNGRFEVGKLAFIYVSDRVYEAIEIEAKTDTTLTLATGVARDYPAGTLVSPVITAYAKTVPASSRVPNVMTKHSIEFTSIEPTYLGDDGGSPVYDSRLLLDDCNLSVSGEQDSWSRPVTVLDGGAGRVSQFSRMLWSRFYTRKVWDAPTQADVWRIRQILHYLRGNLTPFFLPSFRADFQVVATIAASGTSMRVANSGFSKFAAGRRPFGDVRITRTNGPDIVRRIISTADDGAEELITVDTAFDSISPILVADIIRAELVYMLRMSDDTASIEHTQFGQASISINLVTVDE